ncbi:DUF4129 domain-containing protein [Paraliobacillus ryukyuensis]|uniref:DUF4129 domain-containing protein n=1 Tax=Paraliobacillus ryukyuensis TaxID=200904 RepID=UPI0009A8ECEB|nr:DUF4129 domain-containing protein [Paraliobacillus ryukyuensis]
MAKVNEAEKQLEEILDRQEYQAYLEDNRSLFERLWNWIGAKISDWLEGLNITIDPSNNVGNGLFYFLGFLGIVAVFLIVFFASRNWLKKRSLQHRQPLHQNQRDWTSKAHWVEAEKMEQQQDYASAMRHVFLSFLLLLHENKALVARMYKTNWEYYDELRSFDPKIADSFYQFALFFEEVTYGERPIEKEGYQSYRKQVSDWMQVLAQPVDDVEGRGE